MEEALEEKEEVPAEDEAAQLLTAVAILAAKIGKFGGGLNKQT